MRVYLKVGYSPTGLPHKYSVVHYVPVYNILTTLIAQVLPSSENIPV